MHKRERLLLIPCTQVYGLILHENANKAASLCEGLVAGSYGMLHLILLQNVTNSSPQMALGIAFILPYVSVNVGVFS